MPLARSRTLSLLALACSLLLAGTLLATTATSSGVPARRGSAYRTPAASFKVGDPGLGWDGSRWIDLATGAWDGTGTVSTAPAVQGPWTQTGTPLLTGRPAWASGSDHSVWAPSIVPSTAGRWTVFYAAVVKGQRYARCIGTADSTSSTGPFTPAAHPIACYSGSGTSPAAVVRSEGAGFSLIDPTVTVIDGAYHLTFKTQFRRADHQWHTTTRLLDLDPAAPATTVVGAAHTITSWVSPSIEENPVLVKRGSTYTLFTSRGWYGTCSGRYPYHTVYRQTTDLAHWPTTPTDLGFPTNARTCGTGDAAVVMNGEDWAIAFSGHYPTEQSSFKLYVGRLSWLHGKPFVKALF